jgi:hypothetical protein
MKFWFSTSIVLNHSNIIRGLSRNGTLMRCQIIHFICKSLLNAGIVDRFLKILAF